MTPPDEGRTPMPDDLQYHDETRLRYTSSGSDVGSKKEGRHSIDVGNAVDNKGRPLVKFFRWRMSRKRRACIIAGIAAVLTVGVLLLLLFVVIIPALIRHYMNKTTITLNYMDVVSIPSDTEIAVATSVNLQHDVPVSATTDEMTVFLVYEGVTFGSVKVPPLDFKSGNQNYNLSINSTMVILQEDGFNALSAAMIEDKEVPLTTEAKVDAHALGLSFSDIDFERTLQLQGFDNLKAVDPDVEKINFFGCSHGVYEMDVNVSVNNPSAMGLDGIGALNMSVYTSDGYLGYAYSLKPSLGMPRGESNQSFRVVIPDTSTALEGVINGFLSGSVNVTASGDNPYATEYEQFKAAISSVNMSVEYSDGLERVTFNASCVAGILSVLG